MRSWYRADAYPYHLLGFPEELLPDVRRVMEAKEIEGRRFEWGSTAKFEPEGPIPVRVDRATKWTLDIGGMWVQGQPVEELAWNGLTLFVPSDHLEYIYSRLGALPRHDDEFSRFEVITHPGAHLMVLPEDFPGLVAVLETALPGAKARAEAFWAERRSKGLFHLGGEG